MNIKAPKRTETDKADEARGPNEEAVNTAQENVSTGYGSPGKASIISGKPDRDAEDKERHENSK
jgi:hypothetical protein